MPLEFQNIVHQKKIKNTAAFQKVQATLTKRGTTRRVWITLGADELKDYKDEDGNIQFNGYLLEEQEKNIQPEFHAASTTGVLTDQLTHILEKIVETKTKN